MKSPMSSRQIQPNAAVHPIRTMFQFEWKAKLAAHPSDYFERTLHSG